ncbi:MAG: hypothetical protein ACKVHM_08210 [Pseudomonadales bacterium]|jgi:hypothetical protein
MTKLASPACRAWTVRASRALNSDPESIHVGPISYDIIAPLNSICVRLEANEQRPIAFDIVFHSLENREGACNRC